VVDVLTAQSGSVGEHVGNRVWPGEYRGAEKDVEGINISRGRRKVISDFIVILYKFICPLYKFIANE
jgi:hypothetical protein